MGVITENSEIQPAQGTVKPLESPQVKGGKRLRRRFINSRGGRIAAGLVIGAGILVGTSGVNNPPLPDSADSSKTQPSSSAMVDRPALSELPPLLTKEEQTFVDALSGYFNAKTMERVMDALNLIKNPQKQFIPSKNFAGNGYFLKLGDPAFPGPAITRITLDEDKTGGLTIWADIEDPAPAPPTNKDLERLAGKFLSGSYPSLKWNWPRDENNVKIESQVRTPAESTRFVVFTSKHSGSEIRLLEISSRHY